ncbi:MAG: hypothetical protein LBD12_01425, partial [Clostridiales Family XIII bacterium]|nr:hypothetical protein [Clostridiales Family XIII bacterium]
MLILTLLPLQGDLSYAAEVSVGAVAGGGAWEADAVPDDGGGELGVVPEGGDDAADTGSSPAGVEADAESETDGKGGGGLAGSDADGDATDTGSAAPGSGADPADAAYLALASEHGIGIVVEGAEDADRADEGAPGDVDVSGLPVLERGEDYTVFGADGDTRILKSYFAPVRYRDGHGDLVDIDNSLVPATGAHAAGTGYILTNAAGPATLRLPADPLARPVRVDVEGSPEASFSMRPVPPAGDGAVGTGGAGGMGTL